MKFTEIFNLEELVTLDEIKNSHRALVKKYHPDVCKGKESKGSEESLKKIVCSFEVLMEYIYSYKYSFREEDVKQANVDVSDEIKEHMKRFF